MESGNQTIWSERVASRGAGYFLDVRETGRGRVFLSMAQSRRAERGGWKQDRIVVFESGLEPFRRAVLSALKVMDRESGDRRRVELEEVHRLHPKAFEKWTPEDDEELRRMAGEGSTPSAIAEALGRTERAVRMRLEGRDAVLASEGRAVPAGSVATQAVPAAEGRTGRADGAGAGDNEQARAGVSPGSGSAGSSRGRRKAASSPPPQ
ncbi:MAG: hypothetical protein QUS11_03465 [Candidatus Fermentibacter sp.]|nr:hypothetical protein [Candidatus Fermentibacter sp.]